MAVPAHSQVFPGDEYRSVIEKVVADLPEQFQHLRSAAGPLKGRYDSNIHFPGSTSSVHYTTANEMVIAEWRSSVASFSNADQALAEYNKVFDRLTNAIIRMRGEQPYILHGRQEACASRMRCAYFQFLPSKGSLARSSVFLTLEKEGTGFSIRLSISNQPAS